MKKFKGTPFSFDSADFVLDKDGEVVACVMTMDSEQDASIAQLFAAAPELLEALQDLQARACIYVNTSKAEAAIAKALGETK